MKTSAIILSYQYGEAIGTTSVRTTQIAQSLTKYFKTVHVISNEANGPSNSLSLYNVNATSIKKKLQKGKEKLVAEETKTKPLFNVALKLWKSFPSNLVLSETNLLYITRSFNIASKIIKEDNITHIYSSIPPYGDHYTAYILKKKYPHLKWIADFRDIHVEPLYKDVYLPAFQQYIENKILKKADLVTTVSQGLVSHLTKFGRPTYAILRGMKVREPRKQYSKFTLSYTGSLFQDFRDPRPIFNKLKEMLDAQDIRENELEIIYAGKDGELFTKWIKEAGLEIVYTNKGLISREEAKEIQDKSHINLLLTSSTPEWQGVLTGKVFEYIESGNATLCLINGVKDEEFETLFRELNAGVVVYNPAIISGKMEQFIMDKYEEWKQTGEVERKVKVKKIEDEHSWDSRVEFMLSKLADNS